MEEVFNTLKKLGIHYELVFHQPVYTVDDTDNLDVEILKGARICKNLFLRDQKEKRHFLVILCSEKKQIWQKYKNKYFLPD